MVLKLYARTGWGGGGGLVALTLAEKQIPFELVAINLAQKENKTPEFLAMHPFGQVPVIVRALPQFPVWMATDDGDTQDDDGFILYESRAICRYLAEKYATQGTPLLPTGLKERALVEQAASIEFANFLPAVLNVVTELVRKPWVGSACNSLELC
jgi:glutathione S-transferase